MNSENGPVELRVSTAQAEAYGKRIYDLITELYPVCRSISGNGVRQTFDILSKRIPLQIYEVPTGTPVLDWTIPKEWNIRDAYVMNSRKKRIIDFKKLNIHVMGYSRPIRQKMTLSELKEHLYTLPDNPDWVPYVTSYYRENWGFCLSQHEYDRLEEDTYEVVIDSELKEGSITYGEFYRKGKLKDEILLTCYTCHPSLCNDNLSGVGLMALVAEHLAKKDLRYSYRILFIPETIGAIAWLSRNERILGAIRGGIIATCVGDPGQSTYKRSRAGDSMIDTVVEKVLKESGEPYGLIDFNPADGSDERQFCSPGINLPMGSLMRTPYVKFPEYHTSADNLGFITAAALGNSFKKYIETIHIIENNRTFINLYPKGEPQLGKRGLYRTTSHRGMSLNEAAIFWVLNYCDGRHSLLDISHKSGIAFSDVMNVAQALREAGLLKEQHKDK